jgi:hypothetical protein
MNEFLNPKSMVTPGVAGAMVMLIANAIVSQFPEAPFRWVITTLSFLVGTVVFYAVAMPIVQRFAFWAVNSLIIFSVGIGTSTVAANVQHGAAIAASSTVGVVLDMLLPSAHAQSATQTSSAASAAQRPSSGADVTSLSCEEQNAKLRAELNESQRRIAVLTKPSSSVSRSRAMEAQEKSGFFNKW